MSALIFIGALAAIVALAFTVSRITGARSHYIEDWKADSGEQILFEDREADTYLVPALSKAVFTTYGRPRRGFVLVTNRRIIAGQRVLFGKKSVIQYMIYPEQTEVPDSQRLGGGLLTSGYQSFLFKPGGIHRMPEAANPFVLLTPSPAARSSFNVEAIRIYTDHAARFPLPETGSGHDMQATPQT